MSLPEDRSLGLYNSSQHSAISTQLEQLANSNWQLAEAEARPFLDAINAQLLGVSFRAKRGICSAFLVAQNGSRSRSLTHFAALRGFGMTRHWRWEVSRFVPSTKGDLSPKKFEVRL